MALQQNRSSRQGGSSTPFVLLLSGPAGAGKTTVARAWARTRQSTAAHLSLDDVRDFVQSGYANPEDGWNQECQRQYELARQGCAAIARLYIQAGIQCVIDDAVFPEWPAVSVEGWRQDLGDLPFTLVVLIPRLEWLVERNQHRRGRRRLRQSTLQLIYEMMLPWREQQGVPIIDNSDLTVSATVEAIDAVLALRHEV